LIWACYAENTARQRGKIRKIYQQLIRSELKYIAILKSVTAKSYLTVIFRTTKPFFIFEAISQLQKFGAFRNRHKPLPRRHLRASGYKVTAFFIYKRFLHELQKQIP
jgi:hypothetical protein